MSKNPKQNEIKGKEEISEAKKYRRQNIYFNSSNDDLYEHFQKQSDKTSYVMGLIRQDMDKEVKSEQDLSDLKDDIQDLKNMMNQVLNKLDGVPVIEVPTSTTEVPSEQNEETPTPKKEEKIDNPGLQINEGFAGALLGIE